uniref:Uncharacterized protein n=1 Tax=Streptomyces sp. NBC_00049 TaxID=2903617 RepID=A0AAU2JLM9_9ACTN
MTATTGTSRELAERIYALLVEHPDEDFSHTQIRARLGVPDDATYRLAVPAARERARLAERTISLARFDRRRACVPGTTPTVTPTPPYGAGGPGWNVTPCCSSPSP